MTKNKNQKNQNQNKKKAKAHNLPDMWLSSAQAQEIWDLIKELDEYRQKQHDPKILLQESMKAKANKTKRELEGKLMTLSPYWMETRYRNNPNKSN